MYPHQRFQMMEAKTNHGNMPGIETMSAQSSAIGTNAAPTCQGRTRVAGESFFQGRSPGSAANIPGANA